MTESLETTWKCLLREEQHNGLDVYTKGLALNVSSCVVSIISPNLPDEMTVFRGKSRYGRSHNDTSERIFGGSGVIIDCQDAGDGTYFSTILTVATLFVRTNGVQPNEIEVEVYLSKTKVYKGKIMACDFHYNLAAIRIVSDTPLKIAKLRSLDDTMSMDVNENHRLFEERSFQLRPHSNLYKILPGDKVIALGRMFGDPYSLFAARGVFRASSTVDCKELCSTTGIDNEGFLGGPVINDFGEVIGIVFSNSTFMPMNIVSKWWAHYKKHREFCRPWIGCEVTSLHAVPIEVIEQLTPNFNNISTGVVVTTVEQDSPAYCCGIRPLDVIVQCDGIVIRSPLEFFEKIWGKAQKSVEFSVLRASNGGRLSLRLIIGETTPDRFYRWRLPIWFERVQDRGEMSSA